MSKCPLVGGATPTRKASSGEDPFKPGTSLTNDCSLDDVWPSCLERSLYKVGGKEYREPAGRRLPFLSWNASQRTLKADS
jgi:hypothetical protein